MVEKKKSVGGRERVSVLEMVNCDCYDDLSWALGASSKVQLEQELAQAAWQWFQGTLPPLHPLTPHKPQSPCQRITDFSLYPLGRPARL